MSELEVFDQACAFAECADLCKKQDDAFVKGYLTPSIVNSAFACEVFLKLLLWHHNINYERTHTLKQLFEMLPEQSKQMVKERTFYKYSEWTDALGFEHLETISNAFVEWRYSYEHEHGTIGCPTSFLETFRNVLREQCANEVFGVTWEEYDQWKRSMISQ